MKWDMIPRGTNSTRGSDMITIAWHDSVDSVALERTFQTWRNQSPDFQVLALVAEGNPEQVLTIQAAARNLGMPVAGAVFPALIAGDVMGKDGVVLLRLDGAPPPLLLSRIDGPDAVNDTARTLAEYVERHLPLDREAALFCIFDAQVSNIATHLDAWYLALADRVNYFGVNAGSESFAPMPCLFDADSLIGAGVLLQLLPDHPGARLEHGYGVPDTIVTATSSDRNRIVQIDWQPALAVYRRLMRERYGVAIDRDNFYRYAVNFPFGIVRADGEVLVRIPVSLGDDDSIACIGEIPPNAVLALLDASAGSHLAPLRLAENLEQRVAGGDLLLFYCAGRRLHKGAASADELRQVVAASGSRAMYGALSLGEIGGSRAGGYPLFHNATLVGVPWR